MTKINTIRFIEREDIELIKYNQLVDSSLGVSIYCYSWYLDAVCDHWGCLVLDDYKAIFPFAYTVKFGQKIIYQPFFTREFSFFGKDKIDLELKKKLLKSIPIEFKKVDFAIFDEILVENYKVSKVVNQELNITIGYENIYTNYSTNAKRLIKKALKVNCMIQSSEDAKQFINFFKQNTGTQVTYSEKHYTNLEKLIETILSNKVGELYQVKLEGEIVAQAIYLFQSNRITYLKGAANPKGKKVGAMFLLMDYIIKENKVNANVFDFGGSRIDSIAEFYKKFGAENRFYFQYSKNEHSWLLKKGKKLRDLLKK